MKRSLLWLLFGVALAGVLAVLVWTTSVLLRFEEEQVTSRQQAAVEEQVRLALWRLDSLVGPRLAREIAAVGYAASQAEPTDTPAGIHGRFVVNAEGMRWLGVAEPPAGALGPDELDEAGLAHMLENPAEGDNSIGDPPPLIGRGVGYFSPAEQSYRNKLEFQARSATVTDNLLNQGVASSYGQRVASPSASAASGTAVTDPGTTDATDGLEAQLRRAARDDGLEARLRQTDREGPLRPVWLDDKLIVARFVRSASGARSIQGSWVDWQHLRGELLAEIGDLLPHASLQPAASAPAADAARRLATLPLRLVPGRVDTPAPDGWSPLKVSLFVAWVVVLAGCAAVFGLLIWSLSLSDRRAAFVSAVTHELRTPLTTFRMYTEMLSEGMVEHKRAHYLSTLRKEADRLGNLVENVLSFSRVEGARTQPARAAWSVGDLIARVEQRLQRRCEEADMRLDVDLPDDVADASVLVDAAAVEQILFNLVDNAAKYAPSETDPVVTLSARKEKAAVVVRVRDYGPGIAASERRRIFEPFAKGRAHQAGTQPGVGLGLALSRRLAREFGGGLTVADASPDASPGCTFVLRLPHAPGRADA